MALEIRPSDSLNVPSFATRSGSVDADGARAAVVIDSIADGDIDHAPSRNAVFDALALKASLDDIDAQDALISGARDRPGFVGGRLISSTLTGLAASRTPLDIGVRAYSAVYGPVWQIDGEDIPGAGSLDVGAVFDFPLDSTDKYAVRWVVERFEDPADPLNEGVEFRIQNLNANLAAVSNIWFKDALNGAASGPTSAHAPTVAGGPIDFTLIISRTAADDVDYVVPASTRAITVLMRLFGSTGKTYIAVLDCVNTTLAKFVEGDTAGLADEVARALAAEAALAAADVAETAARKLNDVAVTAHLQTSLSQFTPNNRNPLALHNHGWEGADSRLDLWLNSDRTIGAAGFRAVGDDDGRNPYATEWAPLLDSLDAGASILGYRSRDGQVRAAGWGIKPEVAGDNRNPWATDFYYDQINPAIQDSEGRNLVYFDATYGHRLDAPIRGGLHGTRTIIDADYNRLLITDAENSTYWVKQLVDGVEPTAIVDSSWQGIDLIRGGQSNVAGQSPDGSVAGNFGLPYPHHCYTFNGVPQTNGTAAFPTSFCTDFEPIVDGDEFFSQYPSTMLAYSYERMRRENSGASPGMFAFSVFYGGQAIATFLEAAADLAGLDYNMWGKLERAVQQLVLRNTDYGLIRRLVYWWTQGESGPFPYETAFDGYIDDVTAMLTSTYGSAPLFIFDQTSLETNRPDLWSQKNQARLGQLAVARARSDVFLAGPLYQYPLDDNALGVDSIHIGQIGRVMRGEIEALVLDTILRTGHFKPLGQDISVVRAGAVITITFNDVPGDGLALDTDWMPTTANYGLVYSDSTTSATISSVAIDGNALVVTLSGTPTGTSKTIACAMGQAAVTNWAGGRAKFYSPARVASKRYAEGYAVPPDLRHYPVAFEAAAT